MQIRPGEHLPIVRQLADPSDSNTNYVRAWVYKHKAGTRTLLATLDLVDQGNQHFTYEYPTPLEESAEGYVISIITRVYTDSGYTSESPLYYRETATYLVDERWGFRFGSGGGADLDYKRVRKIIKEEIEKLPKLEVPVPKPTNLNPFLRALDTVNKSIKEIKIPSQEQVDFSAVIGAIEKVQAEVKNIPEPEKPEKVDLSPILSAIEGVEKRTLNRWQMFNEDLINLKSGLENLRTKVKKGLNFNLVRVEKEEKEKPEKTFRKIII